MRRTAVGIVLAAIATMLMLSACGSTKVQTVTKTVVAGSPDDPASAPDSQSDAQQTDDAGAESTSDAVDRVALHEWATVDDISFRLESFEAVSSIATSEFSDGPIEPAPGAKLYKAVVTWKNGGDSSADIFCGGASAKLIDERGRNFDSDGDAAIEIEGNSICGDGVQPGFKATAVLVFHMPARAVPNSLALWNGDATYDPVSEGRYVLMGPLRD